MKKMHQNTSFPDNMTNEDDTMQEAADYCSCAVEELEDMYACTPLQEGMMAITFKEPAAYTVEYTYQMPPDVEPQRFREAWMKVAQANPILRTRIVPTTRHGCTQVVVKRNPPWQMKSFRPNQKTSSSTAWEMGAPLVRFTLESSKSGQYTFQVLIHHALCEDWSMALILHEAEAAYIGRTLTRHPFRPFIEYIEMQKPKAIQYWSERFENAHQRNMKTFPSLPRPGYQPRPTSTLNHNMALCESQDSSFSLNIKIRLSWAILQSFYTGTNDTLFGAIDSGRGMAAPGIESFTGPTLACMPIHITLNTDDKVVDALEAIRTQWLTEMEFGQIGLQSLLHLGPGPAAACQFQTLLAVEPAETHSPPGLFASKKEVQKAYDTYSLILRCRSSSQGVTIEAHFDPAVITNEQVGRIFLQLENVYQQIDRLEEPEIKLGELNTLCSQDEVHLKKLNLPIPSPASKTVHELIRDMGDQCPDDLAIASWDGNMTFRELENISSVVSSQLTEQGIRRGKHVAVCVEKGKWMPISMLSVMKAGGVFVLLDPSHPLTRLKEIWRQLDAQVIITSKAHFTIASELPGQTFCIDETSFRREQDIAAAPKESSTATPADAVYLTFTSGSTGKPKGVVVHHDGFSSSALRHGRLYGFTRNSRVLQFASPAFDSCIIEHLTALIFGGCVCIPTASDCHSSLADTINEFSVNIACLTPTVARILLPDTLPTLESRVLVGGPGVGTNVKQWESFVNVRNAYGPAECSAVFSVQPDLQAGDASNIGFPTGCTGWIVHPDNHDILMPLGCIGELLVEGPTVGKGYLQNPAQTAEAFINPPPWRQHLSDDGRQMYKTGDLVQYAEAGDGSISYQGRKGNQVKFHGQRIEMADIEHHLRLAFPDSQQVIAEMLPGTEPLLVAFIYTPESSSRASNAKESFFFDEPSHDFRSKSAVAQDNMLNMLPKFMVPRAFLPLAQIPLTASSKTDRRALRECAASLPWDKLQNYRASSAQPRRESTQKETLLQNVWARILNRRPEEMSVTENFFRLGGDSVSAMQISAGCQTSGLKVTVADIMEFPTIAQLAERLKMSSAKSTPLVHRQKNEVSAGKWFDLSPIQQLFFEKTPEGHNGFTQQFLLRISQPFEAFRVQQAMETVVHQHPMLRACFGRSSGCEWKQAVLPAEQKSYFFNEHSVPDSDTHVLQTILGHSQNAMDIREGKVLAVDLITTPTAQYLSVMAHHLVIDLVSWRVLLQDLEEILTTGTPTCLPSISFQQWCRLQQIYSKECLDPTISIPSDIPSPPSNYWGVSCGLKANTWGETLHESMSISESATREILGSCNDAFHTRPVEIIHAAILHAFSEIFDDRVTPTIFSEGHGREPWDPEIDISRTIGWFTTMVPFFVQAEIGQPVEDLLVRVKERRRSMPSNGWEYFASRYNHEDGFKACQGHEPIEILFNYTGLFQQLERSDAVLQLATLPDHDLVPIPPDLPRFALIDVSATVMEGSLRISFWYNKHMEHADRLIQWIHKCEDVLEGLPAALQQPGRFTLSDFPLLSLKKESDLQRLINLLNDEYGIKQRNIHSICPLSPIQLGMWLSQLKTPDMYWSQMEWVMRPPSTSMSIDLAKCRDAWQSTVNHHPILRTVFTEDIHGIGQPVQVILQNVAADIHISDDTLLEDEEFTSMNARQKWLGKPSHRISMTPQADGKVFCKLSIHHMLVDGATRNLILSDFRKAYDEGLSGSPGTPYSSFLTYLQERDDSGSIKYWKKYLQGAHPCIFPTLEPIGMEQQALHSVPLKIPFSKNLQTFCRQRGITVSNLFQIAWGLVLRAYTGSDAVCFGYLASGRDIELQDAHQIAGPMINLLICRLTLNGDTTIKSTLVENQGAYSRSLRNQHFALADVVHSLGLSGQVLFNTAMSLQMRQGDLDSAHTHGTKIDFLGGSDNTEYPLTVNLTIGSHNIHGDLTYNIQTLSDPQAEFIADAFQRAAEELLDPGNSSLSDIELFGPVNQERFLELNNKMPSAVLSCIHIQIYKNTSTRPKADAVCAWDGKFSYQDLESLSSRLAHYLAHNGVGPETFVPICCDKSKWAVVAILAVLKAGGAFIVLDPCHPLERLQELLQVDFDCPLVLASNSRADKAASLAQKSIIVDHDWSTELSSLDPVIEVSPNTAAYAIFTSGSTGKPKASIIEHKAFLSAAEAHCKVLRLGPYTRAFQFASYAFDASIVEMLSTLLAGGCICIPSESDRQSRLQHTMRNLSVNWTLLTPSVARVLDSKGLPDLKTLVLGGEGMSHEDVRRWSPYVELINAYGPSECSVIATAQDSTEALANNPGNIGRPVGCVGWVVHPENLKLRTPIGALGELLIEGPIVGRGYRNRPILAKSAYPDIPCWLKSVRGTASCAVYRTGDLVRCMPDGSLHYLGRKDRQVKLNGQRLELHEVEYHVQRCFPGAPEVFANVVKPENEGSAHLVASIHTASKSADTSRFTNAVQQAKTILVEEVPAFLIPTAMFPLSEVPRMRNGKIDTTRIRLDAEKYFKCQGLALTEKEKYVAEADLSQAESCMRALWSKVLKLPATSIGPDDHFFRLGGDSVGVMKVASSAGANNLQLTAGDIFLHPVLRDLADVHVKSLCKREAAEPLTPFSLLQPQHLDEARTAAMLQCNIAEEQLEDIFPCTPLQAGLVALTAEKDGAYVAQHRYKIPANVDLDRLKNAWQKTTVMHPILRTKVVELPDIGCLQVVINGPELNWKITEEEPEPLLESGAIFGKSLVRLNVVRHNPDHQGVGHNTLVLMMHHALYDAYSLPRIIECVKFMYRDQTREPMEPAPFQRFVKYASSHSASALEAWREQLKDLTAIPFPSLPAPSYRPDALSYETVSLSTGPFVEHSVTKSTAIAFSWAITQSQYQSSEDVVFGMISTGRRAPVLGVETMTGPTIATVPLRVILTPDESISQGLETLQARMAQMVSLEQAGLSQISKLGAEGDLACSFQTLLNIVPSSPDVEEDDTFMEHIDTVAGKGAFSTYALQLTCTMKTDSIDIQALFDEAVVPRWQMQCILRQFNHILHAVCQSPQTLTQDIPVLNTDDRRQLQDWNSQAIIQIPATVTEMISQHFLTQPLAPAVIGSDESWNYQQLEDMAGRLVTVLDRHNVGADSLVPIYMERSTWTIIAILGVVQTGATFVLLDTSHPVSRLQTICEEIEPRIILTGKNTSACGKQFAPTAIFVGAGADFLELPSTDCSDRFLSPDQPLYTVFTSGSTGQPKGVVIENGAFVTMALACARKMGLSYTSRLLQVASYAFDVSIGEILSTLITGGSICCLSGSECKEGLPQAVSKMHPTHAIFTPSLLRVWSSSDLQGIGTIVITGEPARQSDIRKWADKVHLINNYGPAECTVFSTSQGPLSPESAATNIGFPLAGHAWLAHRQDPNRPIPVGAVGELLLQGPLVGRGYLHNPDRSAAVFLPSPQWIDDIGRGGDATSARVYRTGDLARFEADGSLVYLGRCDGQAKLRGQRFELSEVEESIQRHFPKKLQDVIAEVVTPAGRNPSPCLIAYLVTDESRHGERSSSTVPQTSIALEMAIPLDFKAEISSLRSKLQEILPDYMIPSIFLPLAQMPRTIGGKVNRRHLRDETMRVSRQELESFAPTNAAKEAVLSEDQRLLQGIWSKALGMQPGDIGADDSFFRLGGDSISALQATSQARAMGITHSVADLFRLKTIRKIALEFPTSPVDAPVPSISDRKAIRASEMQGAVFPCTPAQRAILLSQVQDQESYAPRFLWHVSASQSHVDVNRLGRAWQKVVDRHPALRIIFRPDESQEDYFEQILMDEMEAPISIIPEMTDMPPGLPVPITSLGQIPHYFTIYRTPVGDITCCLDVNHAIIDATSISIIENDLRHAYHHEYLDPHGETYELYLNLALQHESANAQEYFGSYLAGIPPPTRLPKPSSTDINQISNDSTDDVNQIDTNLSVVTSDIESLCRQTDWTLPNLFYFAWALTLSTFTGSRDICFGSLTSGRHVDVPNIENAVGQFSNMSVCRVRLLADTSLDEAALDLQEHYGHVLAHQMFPLMSIARAAGMPVNEIALTAVNVQYGNSAPSQDSSTDLLTLKPLSGRDPTFQDVMLYALIEESGNIRICMSHRSAQISSDLATQLVNYFDLAVCSILKEREGRIKDLQIFSAAHKERLSSWNPALHSPEPVNIDQLIQRRARQQPSETAVSGWDGEFTYGDLEIISNQTAAALVASGCKKGDCVPVCFEKSRWAIIAILAIMKAGATFVPLDPTHPLVRLREVCQRVNANLIVSSVERAPLSRELVTNCVVVDGSFINRDQTEPISRVDPDQAAYVLFTSGSTGAPKGVVISHSTYAYAAKAHISAFALNAESRVLQFSSYAFDVAVMEILTTLIAGGTVCIISDSERSDMLLKGVCAQQVTHAFLTPSLASSLDPSRASWLDTLILLGEPVSPAHISQWHGFCRLINAYGPTEGSVINTVRTDLSPKTDAPNIGWPIDVHCWVVDPNDHERLLPVGAIGELMLCGPSVAHGYLDQQSKTKENFPDPPRWFSWFFDQRPSCWRFYKTGDLVRYDTTDGSLRFEGRKDDQVKVRGQRIELGDIEYHAQRCFPGAREVIVDQVAPRETNASLSQNHQKAARLVAWVYIGSDCPDPDSNSPEKEEKPIESMIGTPDRTFHIAAATALSDLREALPSYMIPEVFLPVSYVPLMKSGKTDRKQLKQATSGVDLEDFGGFTGKAAEKQPVQTTTEAKLQSILLNLLELGSEEVGVDDSFFHLGGDSILAMKLAAYAREQDLNITSHDILRHPTIRHWGQIIDNTVDQSPSKLKEYSPFSLIKDSHRQIIMSAPLENGSVEDILPALESQEYYIRDSSPVSYVHLFSESVDLKRLRQACLKAFNEYTNLRSMFLTIKEKMFQVIIKNAEPNFDFVEDEDPEAYMARLSRKKLMPATVQGEMPIRFTIVTAPRRPQWVLIIQLSHAQYDGGCLGFLWEAIKAAYLGHELPVVVDFRQVVHQRRGHDNRESLEFWRKYLEGSCFRALDPMDHFKFPGPLDKDTPPRQVRREIPKPSLMSEITLANLVKAAIFWILARDSGLSDIVLGQVVHGRGSSLPGIDRAFGPCVSFLPIRMILEQSWTVMDLLQHVQTQQLATVPHDMVSMGDIASQCTDWGKDAKFGVLVHHQGLGSHGWLDIDGVCSSSSAAWGTSRAIPGQVTIFSVEQEGSLDLMIAGPVDALDEEKADSFANQLGEAIALLSTGLNLPLDKLDSVNSSVF